MGDNTLTDIDRFQKEVQVPGPAEGGGRQAGQLKIGSVTLKNNLILAPMAGVSDLPFRVLCKEQGAGLVCMEMISAKAILYGNRHTDDLMASSPGERPVSLQLFGSDPDIMADMAQRIEDRPFDIFDINMGCPVQKVVKNGEGSALMKDPEKVFSIVSSMVRKVQKPVTVKIRKGWDDGHVNAVEIAKIAEQAGASAIAVHGRTREQLYSGKADWDIIRQVKEAVKIPVIGNGDIVDPASAEDMIRQTGCDGIMIGRGARGNPWIFRRILEYRRTGTDPGQPDFETVRAEILRQARMAVDLKGERTAMSEMRKHVAWYTAGMPHSAALRRGACSVSTMTDLQALLFG